MTTNRVPDTPERLVTLRRRVEDLSTLVDPVRYSTANSGPHQPGPPSAIYAQALLVASLALEIANGVDIGTPPVGLSTPSGPINYGGGR